MIKILSFLIVLFALMGCKKEEPGTQEPGANFILVNNIVYYDYTTYSAPRLIGKVKNIGSATGYNVCIKFTAYKNNVIIDTASGYPANLGYISAGIEANFEAIFFTIVSHNDYDRLTYIITFLTY